MYLRTLGVSRFLYGRCISTRSIAIQRDAYYIRCNDGGPSVYESKAKYGGPLTASRCAALQLATSWQLGGAVHRPCRIIILTRNELKDLARTIFPILTREIFIWHSSPVAAILFSMTRAVASGALRLFDVRIDGSSKGCDRTRRIDF